MKLRNIHQRHLGERHHTGTQLEWNWTKNYTILTITAPPKENEHQPCSLIPQWAHTNAVEHRLKTYGTSCTEWTQNKTMEWIATFKAIVTLGRDKNITSPCKENTNSFCARFEDNDNSEIACFKVTAEHRARPPFVALHASSAMCDTHYIIIADKIQFWLGHFNSHNIFGT